VALLTQGAYPATLGCGMEPFQGSFGLLHYPARPTR
jgi:hypothetical protein